MSSPGRPGVSLLITLSLVVVGMLAIAALVVSRVAPSNSAPVPTGPPSGIASVLPLVESEAFSGSGDIADDAAIRVDARSPANSVVIAGNKAESGGGIGVFDMDGQLIQFRADGKIGNVDLREGFPSPDGRTVLVGANNRTNDTLALWTLDTRTRSLSPVSARSIETIAPNYGFCMYRSKISGKFYAFVTPDGRGDVQQFELSGNGVGKVDATLVRTLPVSSITESCVADDDTGELYVGQEDVAIWRYGAEPDASSDAVSVDRVGAGHLVADIEGMSIAYGAGGSGYLIVSSQGDSTIAMYDRAGRNRFITKVKVVSDGTIDAVSGTDGLDVTSRSGGPGFERGLLVVHDEANTGGGTSNLKYVPLAEILDGT